MIKRTGGQPLTIGFYGDSFCCETSTPHSIAKGYETYIAKLKKHTGAKIVHLGEGGSSVWDVVLQQFNPADVPDVCIFCWTDSSRLYNKKIRNMTYGSIKDKKLKDITLLELFHRGIINAAKHYYNNLYDPDKHQLEYKSLLYYFDKENVEGHYDKNGKSVQKALMKTPINGARLSSSFGMRKHPIDGFNKMHRGTDFAAPKGTPIMASGNGIIQKAGWCGGGGNCVKIRHNSTYETVYAHMSKFARGIKKGIRVKQGQTIGYVGSTGKSTGPHLHYEVIVNGKKVNSQKLKLPSGKVLKGKNRELFETNKIKLNVLKSETIIGLN